MKSEFNNFIGNKSNDGILKCVGIIFNHLVCDESVVNIDLSTKRILLKSNDG